MSLFAPVFLLHGIMALYKFRIIIIIIIIILTDGRVRYNDNRK